VKIVEYDPKEEKKKRNKQKHSSKKIKHKARIIAH